MVEKDGKKSEGMWNYYFIIRASRQSESAMPKPADDVGDNDEVDELDVDGVDGDVRRLVVIIIAEPIGPWPKRMNRAVVDGAEMNLCGIIKKNEKKENRLTRQEIRKKGRNKLKMFRRKEVEKKFFKRSWLFSTHNFIPSMKFFKKFSHNQFQQKSDFSYLKN